MKSRLPAKLVAVYRSSAYRVDAPRNPFVLRVGRRSRELSALMSASGHGGAAFITACNPLGEAVEEALNVSALAALKSDLLAQGCALLDGVGEGKEGWAGERSVLALGLGLAAAKALGRKYGQNALLWAGKTAVPRLVLLR